MVTIIKTMVTIINKMTTVTIINKMTKSKWSFASVHEKRYSSYLFHCQKNVLFYSNLYKPVGIKTQNQQTL